MKKMLVAVAAAGLILAGCTNSPGPNPTPTSVSPSETVSEAVTTPPAASTTAPPAATTPPAEGTDNPAPATESPSSDTAAPPATQFASRWGARYPNVPEFAILKAANGTCRAIEAAGTNWNDSTMTMAAIEAAVAIAGINGGDALEFAQDAEQNYCGSVSNPT